MMEKLQSDERGQAFTLEGVVASLMVLTAIVIALQATAITPLTASTANERVEEQSRMVADDMLDTASDKQVLEDAVLYWNTSDETFYNAPEQGYSSSSMPDEDFFNLAERTLSENQGLAFNIYITYQTEDGYEEQRMVYSGEPSDNAVSVHEQLILHDDTKLTSPESNEELQNVEDQFYAPDMNDGNNVYNVIEVEMTVWKV